MRDARYRQIQQRLRAAILDGRYQPGDKLPTEMELAASEGVSRTTSAAALTELAREGLVVRVPRRGTIVNAPADRPLARGRPLADRRPLVAWIQPNLDPAYSLDVLRGIEHATWQAGYNLMVRLTHASQAVEEQAIRDAVAAGAVGLMLFLQDGETYNGEVLRLVLDQYPLVLVDRYLPGLPCACVGSDNVGGAHTAVRRLIEAGHRHICLLVHPPKDTSTILDRHEGYARALASHGLPFDPSLVYVFAQERDGPDMWSVSPGAIKRLAAYLRRKPQVTAVFATNALLAVLALRAAAYLGRRVPDDLAVIAIDAVDAYPSRLPPIPYAAQPGYDIGTTAVELLLEQLAGGQPRRVMLPMRLQPVAPHVAGKEAAT